VFGSLTEIGGAGISTVDVLLMQWKSRMSRISRISIKM
jgi:hypothetical protein